MHAILGAVLLLGAPGALAACTREALIASAETYIAAQLSGKLDGLNLASNFTYQENNKAADVKKGVLSTALKLDHNRTSADTVECASYTMLIASTGSKPYVIATQIRHNGDDTKSISMIDTIAATTGSLFFNAPKTLSLVQAESWPIIPEGKRSNRETLKKIGDSYLDMWTDAKAADSIPWGTDCERVEGSQLTKPCGKSLPHGGSKNNNINRRYVVDEALGSVDILCAFNAVGSYPDSHEIRVEDGKVKYVHTVTV